MSEMQLRDYQSSLIVELRDCYRAGALRVCLQAPTGCGKTVIFSFVAKSAVEKGLRVMVLAHRSEILDQIEATMREVGVPLGVIRSKQHKPVANGVTVASVQALVNRFDRTPVPDLVIVDECAHAVASTWAKVFATYSKARFLGVTAVPERLDGRGLGEFFSQLVIGPPVQELIDEGFLAKPIYYAPSTLPDVSGLTVRMGDFAKGENEALMNRPSITGDAVCHYRRYLEGRTAIAFCISIEHARNVSQAFRNAGVPSDTIDGNLSDSDRRQRVADLASGAIKVLTSCEIVSEGFNLPSVGGCLLLRPTASLSMHLQQLGRTLRPAPGKPNAVILDHAGNCLRHGLAEEPRDWTLEGSSSRRRAKEAVMETRQCPQCYAIYQGTECPQCHHVRVSKAREIEMREGELRQLEASQIAARRLDNIKIGTCKSYAELAAIGKAKGYASGWAYFRWKASRQNPANRRKPSVEKALV